MHIARRENPYRSEVVGAEEQLQLQLLLPLLLRQEGGPETQRHTSHTRGRYTETATAHRGTLLFNAPLFLYVRAQTLGQREALSAERRRLRAQAGQRGLRAGVLDHAVHVQLERREARAVRQGLAKGGGALLRRRALEGEGGATAGRTARVQLLEQTQHCSQLALSL